MKNYNVLHLFSILIVLASRIEARAVPQEEIAGVNLGGLHADLKTNLFAPDGPLAQLGNEIASSANQLQEELAKGQQALEDDIKKTRDFLGQGTQQEVAGVNIAGLHAGIKTNLFSEDGPLAQVGSDLAEGEKQLENDLTKGANALGASLLDATNALQAQWANGLKNFEDKIPPATGGSPLDDLDGIDKNSEPQGEKGVPNPLQIPDFLSGEPDMNPGRSSQFMINLKFGKPGQDQPNIQNDEETSLLQGDNSGGDTITSFGGQYGSNPLDLSDLLKNVKLQNPFDNSQGYPDDLNPQNLKQPLMIDLKFGKPGEDTQNNQNDEETSLLQGDSNGGGTMTSFGVQFGSNPLDLTDLLKNVKLQNPFDNSPGISEDLNPQNLKQPFMLTLNMGKPVEDPPNNQNDEQTSLLQSDNNVGDTLTGFGGQYDSNSPDLSDLFKNIKLPNPFDNSQGTPEESNPQNPEQPAQGLESLLKLPLPDIPDPFKNIELPNIFDNSQGVPEDVNSQKLLDVFAQGLKTLSELPAPDLSDIFKDTGVPDLSVNFQGIPEDLNPLKLLDQLAEGLKSLSEIPPPDISGLLKNFELPNLLDNSQGVPEDLNPQMLLEQLSQGFKSLSELAKGGELPFQLPNIDLEEALALPDLMKIPPLPLDGLVLEEAVDALPAIAALSVV